MMRIASMMTCEQWDIVLVPFSFTNLQTTTALFDLCEHLL